MESAELVDRTYFEVLREEILLPWLAKPIDKLIAYLKECRDIFALVGVFGAMSVYSRNAISNSDLPTQIRGFALDFAVGSGFSIVILLSLVVLVILFRKVATAPRFASYENLGLLLFALFYAPLVFVIAGITSQFGTFWGLYGFTLVYAGPFIIVFSVFSLASLIQRIISKKTNYDNIGGIGLLILSVAVLWYIGKTGMGSPPNTEFGKYSVADWVALFNVFFKAISGFVSTILLGLFILLLAVSLAYKGGKSLYSWLS